MKKFLIIITFLSLSSNVFAQLSNRHWIPPLHARQANLVEDHYLYLSTPIETPFEVTVTTGDGNAIQGSPFTISKGNPVSVLIGDTQPSSMFVNINEVGIPTSKGLILQGSKDFYTSFRVRSANHAEILVSKGKTALGTSFRVGSLPQVYDSTIRNFVTSFMATEDNTLVNVTDYDSNVVFLTANGNLVTPFQNFFLNKGESIVLAGNSTFIQNLSGFSVFFLVSSMPSPAEAFLSLEYQ